MGITSFSPKTVIDYVPEYGDNRETENPCIVGIRFISFGEAREQQKMLASRSHRADTHEKSMAVAQALQQEQFVKHIDYVKNYDVDGEEVTDPGQFYMTAPADLITEVLEAMQDSSKLSGGQLKNFERASGGASS